MRVFATLCPVAIAIVTIAVAFPIPEPVPELTWGNVWNETKKLGKEAGEGALDLLGHYVSVYFALEEIGFSAHNHRF